MQVNVAEKRSSSQYISVKRAAGIGIFTLFTAFFMYWLKINSKKNSKSNSIATINSKTSNAYHNHLTDVDNNLDDDANSKEIKKIIKDYYLNIKKNDLGLQHYNQDDLQKLLLKNTVSQKDYTAFETYGVNSGISNSYCHYALYIRFFYGMCDEDEKRLGWACVWRNFQTSLAHYGIFYTLKSLSNKYRNNKNDLEEKGSLNTLCSEIFGDAHIDFSGPVIYRSKRNEKVIENDEFSHIRISGFFNFTIRVKEHFNTYQTPILMCDGASTPKRISYCYMVLGIKKMSNNNVVLWIADPHKTSKKEGLYYLELNEDGSKVTCTGIDDGYNGLQSAQSIDMLRDDNWIVIFPKKIRPI